MRAWIVRETGEPRQVEAGELYSDAGTIRRFTPTVLGRTVVKYPVLSATEAPTREEWAETCQDWWFKQDPREDWRGMEFMMAAYDLLFGQPEGRPAEPPEPIRTEPAPPVQVKVGAKIFWRWIDRRSSWSETCLCGREKSLVAIGKFQNDTFASWYSEDEIEIIER
jgi:hypothetical protein